MPRSRAISDIHRFLLSRVRWAPSTLICHKPADESSYDNMEGHIMLDDFVPDSKPTVTSDLRGRRVIRPPPLLLLDDKITIEALFPRSQHSDMIPRRSGCLRAIDIRLTILLSWLPRLSEVRELGLTRQLTFDEGG